MSHQRARKTASEKQYVLPASPYDLALAFCMERLLYFLKDEHEHNRRVHVVFESRGNREDNELELQFRRVADGENLAEQKMPFEPLFVSKRTNCCGLQLADLVARPIGLKVLRPDPENRAYQIIQPKIRTNAKARQRTKEPKIEGFGLKIFP